MEFKSYADLESDIIGLMPRLPRNLDLIVAVPRSGLVPASMIALHMNLPLTDLQGFYDGRLIGSGHRKLRQGAVGAAVGGAGGLSTDRPLNVLIVDDSVGTGDQMREIRQELARRALPHTISVAVAYATPAGAPLVDYYGKQVPTLRHFFAWNVMHHPAIGQWCVDIDGVLCRDCTVEEDDEGPRYAQFLETAEPLFLPTAKVGWLVTGRLERHRSATEAWLQRHNVAYENLVMHPASTNAERKASGGGGSFKGAFYRTADAGLFIESSPWEAKDISRLTGKPVLCMETRSMVTPNATAVLSKIARKGPGAYLRYARRLVDGLRQRQRNARFAQSVGGQPGPDKGPGRDD